jgi:hypothetical protein
VGTESVSEREEVERWREVEAERMWVKRSASRFFILFYFFRFYLAS